MCGFPAAHLPHFQTRPRRQKGITTERFSSIPFSSCCSILSCHPSCQTDLPSGPRPLVESLPSRRSRSLDRRRQPPRRFSPLRRWFHSPRRSPPSSADRDRKSTRLNSSHLGISYAVFCLKKKKRM